MPVTVTKIRQKDSDNLKSPHLGNTVVTVINVKKDEYAGIKPGQIGQITLAKWGPYQFALKKIRDGSLPAETKPQPDISKPVKNLDFVTLVNAFVKAAGGNARAAVMLGTDRANLSHWMLGDNPPETFNKDMLTWEHLLELLNDQEKPLLREYYLSVAAERAAKETAAKTEEVETKTPESKPTKAKPGRPAKSKPITKTGSKVGASK